GSIELRLRSHCTVHCMGDCSDCCLKHCGADFTAQSGHGRFELAIHFARISEDSRGSLPAIRQLLSSLRDWHIYGAWGTVRGSSMADSKILGLCSCYRHHCSRFISERNTRRLDWRCCGRSLCLEKTPSSHLDFSPCGGVRRVGCVRLWIDSIPSKARGS